MAGYGDPPKEHRFSSEKQPPKNGRIAGVKNRSTVAKILLDAKLKIETLPLTEKRRQIFTDIIASFGLQDSDLDAEMLSSIGQLAKSLTRFDTQAHNALMDSRHGKASQPIEITEAKQTQYDYSRLTPEQLAELETCEAKLIELYSICTVAEVEMEG